MQRTCFIHNASFPTASCHEHHRKPRAAGGTDVASNLVFLCANCHSLVHRLANMRLASTNKEGTIDEIAMQTFPAVSQRTRLLEVVKDIVESTVIAKDFNQGKEKAQIMLDISHELHSRLKSLAYERRSNGRRVGVAKYIEGILISHVRKNGMSLK